RKHDAPRPGAVPVALTAQGFPWRDLEAAGEEPASTRGGETALTREETPDSVPYNHSQSAPHGQDFSAVHAGDERIADSAPVLPCPKMSSTAQHSTCSHPPQRSETMGAQADRQGAAQWNENRRTRHADNPAMLVQRHAILELLSPVEIIQRGNG